MALENATLINQLDQLNPEGADPKSQGDDHIRMIKRTIKNTFPQITGAITVTHTQINALGVAGSLVPPGTIALWAYAENTIPAGWGICDGVTRLTDGRYSPDLRNIFIRGAGSGLPIGTRGGSETHNHTITVSGTALTVDQIPAHTHSVGVGPWTPDGVDMEGADIEPHNVVNHPGGYANYTTSSVGSGAVHEHAASIGGANNMPPWVSVYYIIKL